MKKLSRGLKNCNPGNIRQSPTKYLGEVQPSRDRAFKQFQSMAYGYRAMFVLLDAYHRQGYTTLRQMISRYAPPIENYTEGYIRFVSELALCSADMPLDTRNREQMLLIVAAMSRMENGQRANMNEVIEGWRLFILR